MIGARELDPFVRRMAVRAAVWLAIGAAAFGAGRCSKPTVLLMPLTAVPAAAAGAELEAGPFTLEGLATVTPAPAGGSS